ncbi:uroporphyrinogen-III synthase [Rhodovulum sp. DZ06]|uniref:uroporphyrinogen-III synthase n=1 Tax=Rhodovulum sp. DZ06 TaxID=3425126 RepID=UPI003D33CC38
MSVPGRPDRPNETAGRDDRPAPTPPGWLITRPEPGAATEAATRAAQGWTPIRAPLTELRKVPAAPDLSGLSSLVFTSANGVRCADLPGAARALPAWCVGPATAEAARAAGFDARTPPEDAGGNAEALAAHLSAALAPGARLLHLRGRHGTGGLAEALARDGITLSEAVVYEMAEADPAPAAAALRAGRLEGAGFWSPRAARLFAGMVAGAPDLLAPAARISAAAISPAAAAALAPVGFRRIVVSERPDGAAMDAAALALLSAR